MFKQCDLPFPSIVWCKVVLLHCYHNFRIVFIRVSRTFSNQNCLWKSTQNQKKFCDSRNFFKQIIIGISRVTDSKKVFRVRACVCVCVTKIGLVTDWNENRRWYCEGCQDSKVSHGL